METIGRMPHPPFSGSDEQRRGDQQRSPRPVPAQAATRSIRSLAAWEKALARHLVAAELTASAEEPFHGRLQARDLDVVRLVHLEASPHFLGGRPSDASPSYLFVLPVQGTVVGAQEG